MAMSKMIENLEYLMNSKYSVTFGTSRLVVPSGQKIPQFSDYNRQDST